MSTPLDGVVDGGIGARLLCVDVLAALVKVYCDDRDQIIVILLTPIYHRARYLCCQSRRDKQIQWKRMVGKDRNALSSYVDDTLLRYSHD